MGSKKRSPQHPASPAAGEVAGDAGGPPPAGKAAPETAPVGVVPRPPDVAPFLTKVYDMVSDPATDAVISWAAGGGSFVIWDSHAFERDLLPRHFKHNHFTSFIRQLNTYGFHKVDPDRWEWANEGFVKGQKHLLKTIKRKKKSAQDAPSDLQPAPVKTAPGTENIEIGKYGGLEKEVETLKRDKALLMQQLVDLRQYQQSSSLEVQNLIQRLRVMEQNQQQMMALLAMVVQNPNFLNQLVQQQRRSNWWNDDGSRKRRFRALEQGPVADQETSGAGAQIIQYNPLIPETPNQVISVNGTFSSATAQPVSSPETPDQETSGAGAQIIQYNPLIPETPNQVISVNGAICSTTAQPVSSPESAVPMDAETTSNSVDLLVSCGDLFTNTSALSDWDDMLLGCEIEDILSSEQDFQMGEQQNSQVEAPLTVDDYTEYTVCEIPQLEQGQQLQDCQMEAQQSHKNPQYADIITKA